MDIELLRGIGAGSGSNSASMSPAPDHAHSPQPFCYAKGNPPSLRSAPGPTPPAEQVRLGARWGIPWKIGP